MSDSDKNLRIKITTVGELAGAKAVEKSLEAQIGKAKALGKDYKDLAAQLAHVQEVIKNSGAKMDDAAEKSKFFGLKLGELRRLTREMGEEFPIAGKLAQFMINPIVATFTIAIGIFAAAKEGLDEWNKTMDEAGDKAAAPQFQEAIDAQREALEDATVAQARAADATAHLIDVEEKYRQAVRDSIDIAKELAAARETAATSEHGFDADLLKHELEIGLLSEAQYYEKLTAIEIKYEQDKLARTRAAHAQEIAAMQGMLDRTVNNQVPDAVRARDAAAAHTAAKSKSDSDAALLKSLEDSLPNIQLAVKTYRERLDPQSMGITPDIYKELGLVMDKIGGAKPIMEMNQQNAETNLQTAMSAIARLKAKLPGEKSDEAVTGEAETRTRARSDKDITEAEDARREMENLKIKYGTSDQTDAAAGQDRIRKLLEGQDIGGGYHGIDVEEAAKLEKQRLGANEHLAGAQPLTQQQNQWLDDWERYVQLTGGVYDRQQQLLAQIISVAVSHDQQLASFRAELNLIRKNTRQPPNAGFPSTP